MQNWKEKSSDEQFEPAFAGNLSRGYSTPYTVRLNRAIKFSGG